MQPLNQFMTWCAIGMVATQIIFAINFFYSMFFGPKSPDEIRGRQTDWNGRLQALQVTATSTSNRSFIVVLTNMDRQKRPKIIIL